MGLEYNYWDYLSLMMNTLLHIQGFWIASTPLSSQKVSLALAFIDSDQVAAGAWPENELARWPRRRFCKDLNFTRQYRGAVIGRRLSRHLQLSSVNHQAI